MERNSRIGKETIDLSPERIFKTEKDFKGPVKMLGCKYEIVPDNSDRSQEKIRYLEVDEKVELPNM